MIKIEKNIPLPLMPRNIGEVSLAIRTMEIGDSFFVDREETINKSSFYRDRTKKFVLRKVDGGQRIWRIA